jgi:hypothetical protein
VEDLGREERVISKINIQKMVYGSVDCIHKVDVRDHW